MIQHQSSFRVVLSAEGVKFFLDIAIMGVILK